MHRLRRKSRRQSKAEKSEDYSSKEEIPIITRQQNLENTVEKLTRKHLHLGELLHEVIRAKRSDLIGRIIRSGCDVNVVHENRTPLMTACRYRDISCVEELLTHGSCPVKQTNNGESAFTFELNVFQYIEEFNLELKIHVDIFCKLMQAIPEKFYKGHERNFKPLLSVLCKYDKDDDIALIQQILKCGIPANAIVSRGQTMLFSAVSKGRVDICKLLLDHNANVNIADDNMYTPLHYMLHVWKDKDTPQHRAVAKLLLEHEAEISPLCEHTEDIAENVTVLKYLVDSGMNVNTQLHRGTSLLHLAVDKCDPELVKFLLSKGIKINLADASLVTPLHQCAVGWSKHAHQRAQLTQIIQTLLDADAGINSECSSNIKPLLNEGFIKCLLEYEVDVDSLFYNSNTMLHLAITHAQFSAVELLIKHGADVNAVNDSLDTPLHECVRSLLMKDPHQMIDTVDLLLDQDVLVNKRNARDLTALESGIILANTLPSIDAHHATILTRLMHCSGTISPTPIMADYLKAFIVENAKLLNVYLTAIRCGFNCKTPENLHALETIYNSLKESPALDSKQKRLIEDHLYSDVPSLQLQCVQTIREYVSDGSTSKMFTNKLHELCKQNGVTANIREQLMCNRIKPRLNSLTIYFKEVMV